MSREVCGVSEKIRGYKGIGPEAGGYVPEDQALAYAMERCQIEKTDHPGDTWPEFCEMLVDWFFSGNWIAEEAATS